MVLAYFVMPSGAIWDHALSCDTPHVLFSGLTAVCTTSSCVCVNTRLWGREMASLVAQGSLGSAIRIVRGIFCVFRRLRFASLMLAKLVLSRSYMPRAALETASKDTTDMLIY